MILFLITMNVAFIDPSLAGVSGDMLTAALIDAGAPASKVRLAMLYAAKPFGSVSVVVKRVSVNEIMATRVECKTTDSGGRSYPEIVDGIKGLRLQPDVKSAALEAVKTLGIAEAKLHGKSLKQLRLHEVGAADAIADIVGCCTAAHELGLLESDVFGGEVAVGKGSFKFAHGRLPLPSPATLEILKGVPLVGKPIDAELTTPTGAALLATLVDRFIDAFPPMKVNSVGYGAGSRKLPIANLVRVCLGEASELQLQEIAVLETNVDNVPGDVIGYTIEKLLAEGALDASAVSIIMKKGRPGFLIKVLVKPKDSERLSRKLMHETGTLGVRVLPSVHRYALEREIVHVDLDFAGRKFKPRVKIARDGKKIVNWSAEYEDAKAIAERTGASLREVIRRVEDTARRKIK